MLRDTENTKNNIEGNMNDKTKPKFLYHGSQHRVDVLMPHTACGLAEENGLEYGIYAYETIDMVRPFSLAIQPYHNGNKSFHIEDDTRVTTIYAGLLDEKSKGYIYKVKSDSFYKLDECQWLSKIPVKPEEVMEVSAGDFMDKVIFSGSAKKIHRISESIAYCGLICSLCHVADRCSGCQIENNCCGNRTSPEGCYQYNCCKEKAIEGCWQCAEAPCREGMFDERHDLRLRAFIRYIKDYGKEELADRIYHNMQKGLFYGHGKDYDNLPNDEAVFKLLKS